MLSKKVWANSLPGAAVMERPDFDHWKKNSSVEFFLAKLEKNFADFQIYTIFHYTTLHNFSKIISDSMLKKYKLWEKCSLWVGTVFDQNRNGYKLFETRVWTRVTTSLEKMRFLKNATIDFFENLWTYSVFNYRSIERIGNCSTSLIRKLLLIRRW